MAKRWKKYGFGYNLVDAINIILLLLFCAVVLYPFLYCFILSFNDGFDASKGGIYFWPRVFTFDNYATLFDDIVLLYAIRNTISRTAIGIIVFLFITGMFSYAITRKNLMFRRVYLTMGVITMYFSGGLIPTYLVMRSLGLLNNFLIYILPNFFSMFYAVIMLSYFKTIPSELEESARIDGAGDLKIFLRIFVPAAKPVFACLALYVGVGHWNAWIDTMLYTNSKELQTLSHLLVTLVNNQRYLDSLRESQTNVGVMTAGATSMSVTMATMILTSFPIIILYPFLQKYFIKGVMLGSLKG